VLNLCISDGPPEFLHIYEAHSEVLCILCGLQLSRHRLLYFAVFRSHFDGKTRIVDHKNAFCDEFIKSCPMSMHPLQILFSPLSAVMVVTVLGGLVSLFVFPPKIFSAVVRRAGLIVMVCAKLKLSSCHPCYLLRKRTTLVIAGTTFYATRNGPLGCKVSGTSRYQRGCVHRYWC
jgi:hypothetical protein